VLEEWVDFSPFYDRHLSVQQAGNDGKVQRVWTRRSGAPAAEAPGFRPGSFLRLSISRVKAVKKAQSGLIRPGPHPKRAEDIMTKGVPGGKSPYYRENGAQAGSGATPFTVKTP